MATNSKIEWTEITWNPVTGCSKISDGCKNCYAERMANRLCSMGSDRYKNRFKVTLHHDLLTLPLQWKQAKMIFVNSMSDLFHEDIPLEFIQSVFQTMGDCPQHTFQVLTKRSNRLVKIANQLNWPTNVWMGVSVENDKVINRVNDLRQVPAAVRFLSCEPLIGPLIDLNLDSIHWVIVGGESGPFSRPIHFDWVESIYQKCLQEQVPFFFKQWCGTRKHITGRQLHDRTYNEMPIRFEKELVTSY